jgi:hypothetical protein
MSGFTLAKVVIFLFKILSILSFVGVGKACPPPPKSGKAKKIFRYQAFTSKHNEIPTDLLLHVIKSDLESFTCFFKNHV